MSDEIQLKTYGLVQRIDERTENMERDIGELKKGLADHSQRLQVLEKAEAVQEERENIIRRNPVKTGLAIGGVSMTTVAAIICTVLKLVGVI